MSSDKKGYNEAGKVSVERSADGYRTDIRVGTGSAHSHTVIENGQIVFDRGVDPDGNSHTFVSNDSANSYASSRGDNVPDAS